MNANLEEKKPVFGLDIGTRSIVGTVGYKDNDKFIVLAQKSMEHETRAMLDGQIHDIGQVAETIKKVKQACEDELGIKLRQVCIAAAGRVLRTLDTHVELSFAQGKETTAEDITNLMSLGVEKAYQEFKHDENPDIKFYCVGYSVVKYYLNGQQIGNLLGHKAREIGADIIATFLPDEVVDGLYKSVELADLEVANLTLEPIAAISVAIPEKFRMLNIALVDVGAGTSDISITKDGSIVAYGMIPMAGDSITETIALHCLVDFDMAEKIKRDSDTLDIIEYEDIMGLPQTISREEVLNVIDGVVEKEVSLVAEEIIRLNGDKPVSAVFVVGGGGIITGYTQRLAEKIGIAKERVALRGSEVMGKIVFEDESIEKTSLLITPVGICLNYYENTNNLMYVTFNGKRVKMYDNGNVSVIDVAVSAEFPNDGLFPKRGKALTYSVNGKSKIAKGELGEAAVITVNDEPANVNVKVKLNDRITIKESTAGIKARVRIDSLAEYSSELKMVIQGKSLSLPRPVFVNGKQVTPDYEIQEDDSIKIESFCTREQILTALDMPMNTRLIVNNAVCTEETKIFENFAIGFDGEDDNYQVQEDIKEENKSDSAEAADAGVNDTVDSTIPKNADTNVSSTDSEDSASKAENSSDKDATSTPAIPRTLMVIVNGKPVTLSGKSEYVYVDVFDFIDFDLSKRRGSSVVTTHNGQSAQYMSPLSSGDVLEIYWKE